jgi:hypothetical protein
MPPVLCNRCGTRRSCQVVRDASVFGDGVFGQLLFEHWCSGCIVDALLADMQLSMAGEPAILYVITPVRRTWLAYRSPALREFLRRALNRRRRPQDF